MRSARLMVAEDRRGRSCWRSVGHGAPPAPHAHADVGAASAATTLCGLWELTWEPFISVPTISPCQRQQNSALTSAAQSALLLQSIQTPELQFSMTVSHAVCEDLNQAIYLLSSLPGPGSVLLMQAQSALNHVLNHVTHS
ncbi:hypothetical protein Anapl_08318 [Anas platyrhynchos]|uniref:Uncharacterized protein n=1 Tax=Anas platyrhynchos TaxID=8839 RepID=R0K0F8_ANAPL|nr:hypothetical protein Anapl_08318 [Anas platyrhynchos]